MTEETNPPAEASEPQPAPPAAGIAAPPEVALPTAPDVPSIAAEPAMPDVATPSAVPAEAVSEIGEAVLDAMEREGVPRVPEQVAPAPTQQGTKSPETAAPSPAASSAPKPSSRLHMQQKVGQRKQERLEKVLALAREKGHVRNNHVQLMLGVSDATATNYLRLLVRTGRLRRTGAGKSTKYWPI